MMSYKTLERRLSNNILAQIQSVRMINVFLAPCDSPNFDDTVKSAVALSEYPDHPEALDGLEEVRFWGARTGTRNRRNFEKM